MLHNEAVTHCFPLFTWEYNLSSIDLVFVAECQLPKAADVNNSGSGHVIEIKEDHGVQDSKITGNMRIGDHVDDEDKTWHYVDPSGNEQGPFDMVSLRYWMREGFFDEDFKVWKTGQSREDAILLTDALRLYQ